MPAEVAKPPIPGPEPITILVLGPMRPQTEGSVEVDGRTIRLTRLVESIRQEIQNELGTALAIRVEGPDDNPSSDIIPGILRKLERADLVICDLTGSSPNVMYELGLVHALGLPYILVTGDTRRPFYVANAFTITGFVLSDRFDGSQQTQRTLLLRLRRFLSVLERTGGEASLSDFATNPVSAFFSGLPIVDISAPAGLAAGYWANAVRRFVRRGGYFDPPPRTVLLPGKVADGTKEPRALPVQQFVAVRPVEGLHGSYDNDLTVLQETLRSMRLATVEGTILQREELDLRSYSGRFLAHPGEAADVTVIDPGIVIEIPSTLYALQYSPRVLHLLDDGGVPARRAVHEQLLRRRYRDMVDRFGRVLQLLLRNEENKGHAGQVHFVTLDELPALLGRLLPPA